MMDGPQSWNRYAYVLGNPLALIDPLGLCGGGPGEITVSVGGNSAGSRTFTSPPCGGFGGGPLIGGHFEPLKTNGDPPDIHGGFTIGIRGPNQTFNQCLVQNGANYSAGGIFDLVAQVVGLDSNIGNSTVGQILAGNTFTSLYSSFAGSAEDAATAAGTAAPDLLASGIGSTLTFGRRTASITALNLAGKGGLPQALQSSSKGLQSLLGSASKAVNLGLEASIKAAADLGLFGAEIVGCTISRN
jgi:hypothetical protein